MGFQFFAFVVTPSELQTALGPFTLFIDNAHVPLGYTCTPNDVFVSSYSQLFDKLCLGQKIDRKADRKLLDYYALTTDITSVEYGGKHTYNGKEYVLCKGSRRGKAPSLLPFTFSVYMQDGKPSVSTRASWMIADSDIMGFQLCFPKLSRSESEEYGIHSEKDWESYNDFTSFKERINSCTKPFRFALNGVEKKTPIRVSAEAKKHLPDFYCIKKNNLIVL